jgi:uncharacterized Rmd1/YagE family protein
MDCVSYCTAFAYDVKSIVDFFRGRYETEVIDEVIHVAYHQKNFQSELFFFPYGTFVAWDLPVGVAKKIIVDIKPYENNTLDAVEKEVYCYQLGEKALFNDDIMTLPTEEVKVKLAFSHALAHSAKLGAFEGIIQKTFEDNKHLPESLAKYGKIPLSRFQIRKKIGQLFLDRTSISLHLDVLDIPEFFWENPEYEPLYEVMAVELDLHSRISTLNQQLGVIHDLFEMLSHELNDQHSSRLEWAIIILIVLEVVILLLHDVLKVI